MRLSVVLLWCLFMLCISGAAYRPLFALTLRDSSCAALSLLLLAANAFTVAPVTELSVNPAAVLLLVAAGVSTRSCSAGKLLFAILLALPSSLCMLLLLRFYVGSIAGFPEPGLLAALIGVLFALPLWRSPSAALFEAALAPFLLGLLEAGLDLYSFGYAVVTIGDPVAFDAQIAGVFLAGLVIFLLGLLRKPRAAVQ